MRETNALRMGYQTKISAVLRACVRGTDKRAAGVTGSPVSWRFRTA